MAATFGGRSVRTQRTSSRQRGDGMTRCAGFENRNEPPSNNDPTESYESDSETLACFLALLAQKWPDLAELVTAWPDLPEALRAGITAMVRSSAKGAKP